NRTRTVTPFSVRAGRERPTRGLPAGAGTVAFPAGGRTMPSRRQVITGGVGVAAGSAVAGCSGAAGANPAAAWAGPGSSGGSSASANAPAVTFAPAADSTGVVPGQPVVVSTDGGTLQSVTVAAGNHIVAGALDTDRRTWRSTGDLAYGQTYVITAVVADP